MTISLTAQSTLHDFIVQALSASPHMWGEDSTSDVQKIETHGATVLLGSHFAIKIKKPVLFDHMDYSTPDRRKKFCEIELERNKRTAKDLYIGVFPIFVDEDSIRLTGTDMPAEYFIKMRRFQPGERLDEIAEKGPLATDICLSLAEDIADLHQNAEVITDPLRIPDFEQIIHQNFQQFYDFCPDILAREEVDLFLARLNNANRLLEPQLIQQIAAEQVRVGHGDLHLQNICRFEGSPRIFDAIEYQDDFTISDILYDFAFLLMDLIDKDQHQAASLIFNEYVVDMGWILAPERFEALRLLPFYLSMRAGIRCHVAANRSFQCDNNSDKEIFRAKAKALFQTASDYLAPAAPSLYAIGGFSGSGKSTLARRLAADIQPSPGAVVLRTDVIRRQLMGADKFNPMPQSAYTPEMSERVYARMRELAGIILSSGVSVILDAVFDRAADRDQIDVFASEMKVPFQGIWLNVEKGKMTARINARTNDASDATEEILERQLTRAGQIKTGWMRVPANGTPAENYDKLRSSLAAAAQERLFQ